MLLAQYNVSRLIDRLEMEGLVERRAVAGDRRRQTVHITQEGRGLLKRMWPVYEKAIGDRFAGLYSGEEARALATLLSRAL
jgi:DNA-binding MarR family transcriptional regulator